jgi:hypothetical protein
MKANFRRAVRVRNTCVLRSDEWRRIGCASAVAVDDTGATAWHRYALQVHKALSVPSPDLPLPLLPAYVRRNHDDALDARRLGRRMPFPRALSAAASGAYLSEEDRVGAPADWFEQGLQRASRDRIHGLSLLPAVRAADDQPGEADSYDIHEGVGRTRRHRARERVPPPRGNPGAPGTGGGAENPGRPRRRGRIPAPRA